MKRLLALSLAAVLLLSGCGTPSKEKTDGSLGSMFHSDSGATGSDSGTVNPDDVPHSDGPTSLPSDLVPHE